MDKNPETFAKEVEDSVSKNPGQPPLDQWHPELSGDMDMVIRRNGQWIFKGEPLTREAIVRLFSTILRREDDGEFYLVTPVEKWRIKVEDAPLLAHTLTVRGSGEDQIVSVTTNVGETLDIGEEHPLDVSEYPGTGEPRPVVLVRHGVEARLLTSAFYDLAAHLTERTVEGETVYGVVSGGKFWKVGQGG
ncbi:hypothetical protein MSNKSG1_06178 [Marinobacter santoriniensis NKSG1]|uniref:Proteophosphoglycan n=1 Tax=Marinobacter santoriniensis NKSG1 TaxID=1288826 RepID=M7CTG0_9GAMM|nr:DUF1285 domain-containing protein [Marinobacter santoriniensis]EMP55435.1 hypothetical protein MSNKSG1_06178 [Marinobacter santoriniensis NKSG1]